MLRFDWIIFLLALIVVPVSTARAQFNFDPEPVSVTVQTSQDQAAPGGGIVVAVIADITDQPDAQGKHWHIYPREAEHTGVEIPTTLTVTASNAKLTVGEVHWPKPEIVKNAADEDQPAYLGQTIFYVPIQIADDAEPGEYNISINFGYQPCASLCLFPTNKLLAASLTVVAANADVSGEDRSDSEIFKPYFESVETAPVAPPDPAPVPTLQNDQRFETNVFGWRFGFDGAGLTGKLLLLLASFVGGFLLNLTPCVLPVIPIKIMALTQQTGDRRQSIMHGLAMGAGIFVFWLAIGAAIVFVSGFDSISSLFQRPIFGISVGVFIAVMGVGMIGAFTVQLPQAVYMFNPKHDTLHGSILFGMMTAVLSTPCTAPFMGSAAAWATKQNNAPLVLAVFGSIALGMGWPYMLLAAFPKLVERVPRTGPASELVKQVMGLLLLAVAAFFVGTGLSGLISQYPYLGKVLYWWVAVIFVTVAVGWLIWRTFQLTPSVAKRLVFTVVGLALLFGVTWWSKSMTEIHQLEYQRDHDAKIDRQKYVAELEELVRSGGSGNAEIVLKSQPWRPYDPEALAKAKKNKLVTIVHFTADW